VEQELNRARDQWRYRIDAGRIRFEHDVHLAHKRLKQSIPRFIQESSPLNILTAPLIYSMVLPIALIDASFSLYQLLCFPLYGISRVRRSLYIVAVDRQYLAISTPLKSSISSTVDTRTVFWHMCARSRGGPSSTGVPSVTPKRSGRRMLTITSSSITAMPRATTGACRCFGTN
jgi:hypothetical protein